MFFLSFIWLLQIRTKESLSWLFRLQVSWLVYLYVRLFVYLTWLTVWVFVFVRWFLRLFALQLVGLSVCTFVCLLFRSIVLSFIRFFASFVPSLIPSIVSLFCSIQTVECLGMSETQILRHAQFRTLTYIFTFVCYTSLAKSDVLKPLLYWLSVSHIIENNIVRIKPIYSLLL